MSIAAQPPRPHASPSQGSAKQRGHCPVEPTPSPDHTAGRGLRRLRRRRSGAFSLAEMMVACGVFAVGALGIWFCTRTVFFVAAKNAGINVSHTALLSAVDNLANQIRSSLQVIDIATFNGTTFTDINEASASTPTSSGNAVRFLRLIPVTLFVLPDDGSSYTETKPQNPQSLTYPDYLTEGNRSVKVVFNTATSNYTSPDFLADLVSARFLPRFPYLTETITSGASPGTLPGLTMAGYITTSANTATITLAYGLPTATQVPSCNQAYLVIVSAAAILNQGTGSSQLLYYPDATNLTRYQIISTAFSASTTGSGPAAFSLPQNAGALSDPTARGSLQINVPVFAPNLNNAVSNNGNTAGLINIAVTLPVETRRRAQF